MKRRNFINTLVPAVFMPSLINGLSVQAFAHTPALAGLSQLQTQTDKVLVLIQLNGGNDGLHTVIPLDQYDNLANARGNIALSQSAILPLTGTTTVGLHPAMTGIQQLYNNGKLCITQGVSYPNPSFSHFRATDIIGTATDSNTSLNTGWIGRYLDNQFPNYPYGYPTAAMPDPPAIQIGAGVPLLFQANNANLAMSISSIDIFDEWVNGTIGSLPDTPSGKELGYLRTIANQTQQYSAQIVNASNSVTSQFAGYPAAGSNPLADQLKLVARLIAGGLKTRVYLVSLGGFDTHAQQVSNTNANVGTHASLLGKLSEAVKAFCDDLAYLNADERVVGLTFSEFGRRIKANASWGTDHGTAFPMLLFGTNVQAGIVGNNPIIPAAATVNDNLPMQYDFRAIYASLLKDWFCLPPTDVNAVMLDTFATLPVVQTACCVPPIISGAANACINGTNTYSVTATAGSTYVWTVTGGTIVAGQGTHQITVQWNNNVQGTVNVEQTTP
jgi:uncharacterized protein (DUF1501 family)